MELGKIQYSSGERFFSITFSEDLVVRLEMSPYMHLHGSHCLIVRNDVLCLGHIDRHRSSYEDVTSFTGCRQLLNKLFECYDSDRSHLQFQIVRHIVNSNGKSVDDLIDELATLLRVEFGKMLSRKLLKNAIS